jgi:hypothetical protein
MGSAAPARASNVPAEALQVRPRPDVEGLAREELESARPWAAAARRYGRDAARELHRRNGAAKVLAAITTYLASGVRVVDRRATGAIARAAGVTTRWAREKLAELEGDGYLLRVTRAGVRLPGQRGWETSAIIVPALLANGELMPDAARGAARAALAELALRDPKVRAALDARRPAAAAASASAAAAESEPPPVPPPVPAVKSEPPAAPPAPREEQAAAPAEEVAVAPAVSPADLPQKRRIDRSGMGFCYFTSDRNRSSPTPPRAVDVERGEDALRAPLDAGAAAPAPPLERDPDTAPREVTPSPPPPAGDLRPPATSAPTPDDRPAGSSRGRSLQPLPPELRGPGARVADVIEYFTRQGLSRSAAVAHMRGWQRTAAFRRGREARGEEGGRPRAQARREARAVRLEAAAADEARDRSWARVRRRWGAAGGEEWLAWIAALRCTGWGAGAGALVVRVAGSADVVERLAPWRELLEQLAGEELGVPLQVAWEVGT